MNDPRPGRRFTVEQDAEAPDTTRPEMAPSATATGTATPDTDIDTAGMRRPDDPAPGAHYSLETVHHPLEEKAPEPADSALDRALSRPRKRRWGLLGALGGAMALGAVEAVDALSSAWLYGDWLSGAWSVLGLGVLGLAGTALGRELLRLKRLRRHAGLRETVESRIVEDQVDGKKMLALCDRLRRQMGLSDRDAHWLDFKRAHQPHHDARETRSLFSYYVLAPRDARARAIVTRMSGETAMLVAISPLTITDMGLMAWRNLRMIDRLSALYGLELGYASRLSLFKAVLANIAFAGASEIATEASMDLLSMNLAGKLSTRAGQGLASGLLTARLGIRTLNMLRPLPYEDEARPPRIADLRRQLWQQMKRVDDGKSAEAADPLRGRRTKADQ